MITDFVFAFFLWISSLSKSYLMLKQFNPCQSIKMLLSRWEEEGRGPIIIKAAEQQELWRQQWQRQGHRDCQHKQEPRCPQHCCLCTSCGCCSSSGQWWNLPTGASVDVDAIAHQLQVRQEEEGWGPIVVKAAELQQQWWWWQWQWWQGRCDCQRKQEGWQPQYLLLCGCWQSRGATTTMTTMMTMTTTRMSW